MTVTNNGHSTADDTPRAVIFDFSGTLFKLEQDPSWFHGMTDSEGGTLDETAQADLVHRLTTPTGEVAVLNESDRHAWMNRDLDSDMHRQAYLGVLRASGIEDVDAASLYERVLDMASWIPYPDTVAVLELLAERKIPVAVLSNIAFDVRPAFEKLNVADKIAAFVLSFEVGHIKPDAKVFSLAVQQLGVPAEGTLMVGDSDEADGAARTIGCRFALVEPAPTVERRTGLADALAEFGIS